MNKIAVLTGAGVSAESGLGTYRDNGGLWDNYDPAEVASIEGWMRNPGKVLDFYNMQRTFLTGKACSIGHRCCEITSCFIVIVTSCNNTS